MCFSVACFVAGSGEACVNVGAGALGSSLSSGGAKSAEPSLPLSGLGTTGAGVSWAVLTASYPPIQLQLVKRHLTRQVRTSRY
ncbi:MAG: hypothetical protein E7L30_05305 [Lactococcus lactis]|nr:hypothetical protein [Lactococcus lactis]